SMVFAGGIGFLISYLLFGNGYVGLIVFLLLSGARAFYSYRYGDRIVLRQSRARPVSHEEEPRLHNIVEGLVVGAGTPKPAVYVDRKSTRLNSSHVAISYAVFCL